MAAPSPAQTPGAPIAPGSPLRFIKRIPPVAWLAIAGIAAGLGYSVIRGKQDPTGPGVDETATEAGVVPDEQLTDAASPVAYVTTSAPASEPAETVGAVGQTALETLTQMFTGALASRDNSIAAQGDIFRSIIEQGKYPIPAPPPPTIAPRPAPAAPPAGRPAPPKTGGIRYHGKMFSGAIRITSVRRSGGVEGFTVIYPHGRQRWHYDYQGAHKGAFRKVDEHWGEHNS